MSYRVYFTEFADHDLDGSRPYTAVNSFQVTKAFL